MTDFRDTLRGIIAMLVCCLFFVLNDTMVKLAGDTMPLGQIIFLRGLVGTVLIAALTWWLGGFAGGFRQLSWPIVLRTFGEVAATLLYLSALMHMPIGNSSAIAQSVPLVLTAAGALFFGEKVGWRRWLAVVIGFAGVMIIVRPGTDGFNAYAFLVLASVLMVALRDISTRYVPASTPTLFVTTVASAAVALMGAGLSVTETWAPLGNREWVLIGGSAIAILLGYVFVIIATRHGDVSLVAPFRYSFIPYAIITGYIFWGDVPDAITVLGIAIVVGTGIYTFMRERKIARLKAAAVVAESMPAGNLQPASARAG